ncbi:putative reverse transcriptase domain-containing protein [Tanacetum coccineum]
MFLIRNPSCDTSNLPFFDMPIENNKPLDPINKPLDPIVKEFCELTGMSLANIRRSSVGDSHVGFDGSFSRGKSRKRNESTPVVDNRGGKRIDFIPIDDEINKILSNLQSGSINSHLKFAMGSSSNASATNKSLCNSTNANDTVNRNDGVRIDKCDDLIKIKCKLKSQLWGMLLQYRVCHIEFSPSVVITESRQNARLELTKSEKRQIEVVHRPLLSYGDGLYAFNLWMKQFSLMWLASSSASSNPLILIFYFFIYLIQKLRQKEVDEESCMKTCSMNWGEANSVYTSYIVSSASNGKIQAGALIFVLVGYIVSNSICHHIGGRLMPPKRISTSEAPAMTQAAIRKLVANSVTTALEAQAANMANTDNTTRPREALVARQCSYKEFMSCQPINFKDLTDRSFIKFSLANNPIDMNQSRPVAKSSVLEPGLDHTGMSDVGSACCDQTSSRDGIAIAKTYIDLGMAGLSPSSEHTSMEDVVNTGVTPSSTLDGIACEKVGSDFMFGRNASAKGILKTPTGPMFSVQFGSNVIRNPFAKNPSSNTFGLLKNSSKGAQACSMQLYGYFVGTSMDYRVVRSNLMKMWRVYDIEDITKTSSRVFYFKFKGEAEKTKPTTIPIWVCVYNIPMELCNGNSIGKIMSGIRRLMIMDKMTKERCPKKSRKLDFARILVKVSAEEELPSVLEIAYLPLGNRPAKIGILDVKYQWKPPLCTFCKTFSHSTLSCKNRPRNEEEIAANVIKDEANMKESGVSKGKALANDDEGFVTVGNKNMHASNYSKFFSTKPLNVRNVQGMGRNGSISGVLNKTPQNNDKSNFVPLGKIIIDMFIKCLVSQRALMGKATGMEKQGKSQLKCKSNVGGNQAFGYGLVSQKKNSLYNGSKVAQNSTVKL